jgi:hypothetical protein
VRRTPPPPYRLDFVEFFTNDGLSRGLGNIFLVSERVSASATSIDKLVQQSEAIARANERNLSILNELSGRIESSMESLRGNVEEVGGQTKALHTISMQFIMGSSSPHDSATVRRVR